jgi:hypothetical protein
MLIPPFGPSNQTKFVTVFAADAMFFQSAKNALMKASAARKGIARAERRLLRHQAKMDAISESAKEEGWNNDLYSGFEPLAIQMENYEYSLTEAHGPVLQQLALVQTLSAMCLEAHINTRAEALLPGREWSAFERLPLDAKWMFLPKVLGLPGFNVGVQPFQGFDAIVRARNGLVHYKPQKEEYHGFDNPDSFAARLKLTFEAGEASLTVTREMVATLAQQLGEREPWWLRSDSPHFFFTSQANLKKAGTESERPEK